MKTRPGCFRPTRLVAWMYSAVSCGWPMTTISPRRSTSIADGDHVGRQDHVERIVVGVTPPPSASGGRDVARRNAAGQLDVVDARASRRSAAMTLMRSFDVVVELQLGAAEHAQAVEVPEQRPVRVANLVGGVDLQRVCSSAAYVRIRRVVWLVPGAMQPDVEPRRFLVARAASTAK